ncbi:forkhead box protein R1 [Lepisosteus oculatus]|uniref:forkhead box protein R1 n=1 Tax=Lepisosteus oculatus TaxID=7918 RepID=UPI0003EADF72|nr:PREDICTED: forkhead box protein R1 [Lepisosteus oculatus]
MYVQVQNRTKFLDLHLATCLKDWDMSEEIKLTTTTDQLCQEPLFEPSLWLVVNPNLACPIKYPSPKTQPSPPGASVGIPQAPRPTRCLPPSSLSPPERAGHDDSPNSPSSSSSSSSDYLLTDEEDASSPDLPAPQKPKAAKERGRRTGLAQSKRLQRILQESCNLKSGCWPRPPVNYCILIAMALSSSRAGSLNVQQIYNFTREHFPFFQTAPDGWKNTIRHNLCFSNSFEKTPQLVCSQGKRKSCLWHLTADGRRRLRNEIHLLTGDSIAVLERSMTNPGMIRTLFEL